MCVVVDRPVQIPYVLVEMTLSAAIIIILEIRRSGLAFVSEPDLVSPRKDAFRKAESMAVIVKSYRTNV
jgi:hypothetical protein